MSDMSLSDDVRARDDSHGKGMTEAKSIHGGNSQRLSNCIPKMYRYLAHRDRHNV